jgi:hypothetical protein
VHEAPHEAPCTRLILRVCSSAMLLHMHTHYLLHCSCTCAPARRIHCEVSVLWVRSASCGSGQRPAGAGVHALLHAVSTHARHLSLPLFHSLVCISRVRGTCTATKLQKRAFERSPTSIPSPPLTCTPSSSPSLPLTCTATKLQSRATPGVFSRGSLPVRSAHG